ncbi:MAG: enoyl-CoA hydratase [Chloroflexi bacterium]|nr:enoyl-CoA hydratase [Chloroflexota bacterium]
MATYKHIVVKQAGGVATVTINREGRLNTISIDATGELTAACRSLAGDDGLRAVVITGAGSRAFCAGADTGDMVPRSYPEYEALVRYYFDFLRALRAIPVPVVARVNGDAVGGGCCLAMACDLRVAAEHARLGVPFVRIGLSGADLAASYLLPRIVGVGRASELLLTGRLVDAPEAQQIGLVNEVVPSAEMDAAVDRLVQWFAQGPPVALRLTKQALQRNVDRDFEAAIDFETHAQALCLDTQDFLEGSAAFREKRPPRFTGR